MGFLDVAKFKYTPNTFKSDYKPDIREKLSELPEYKFADIIEYEDFGDGQRKQVVTSPDTPLDYNHKLTYLIKNNIINRNSKYFIGDKGAIIGEGTTSDPKVDNSTKSKAEIEGKYYDGKTKMSKTDFLVEILKLEEPITSRIILTQSRYKRIDENLKNVYVDREPIETSPYQRMMGELGIDNVQNDVIINHGVFNETSILVTNDVVEQYIDKAVSKNIISLDDIINTAGTEGASYLDTNGSLVDPAWRNTTPIRQYYNEVQLSSKEIEEDRMKDGQYPKKLMDYLGVVKELVEVEDESSLASTYPWGNSFKYSVSDCQFGNPFNKTPLEISKKPSYTIDSTNGYRYFKNEEITLLEAYVLAYKYLKTTEDEVKLTQDEVDFINSTYNLNLGYITPEEKKAVEYLIAKGIIDGNKEGLNLAVSTPLINEDAIDILYRIHNKSFRITFKPNLTDTDKEMLKRGFSQANVTMTNQPMSSFSGTYVSSDNSEMIPNSLVDTYENYKKSDRALNPSSYDYIYVRIPKELTTGTTSNYSIVVNDKYRTTVTPDETFFDQNGEHMWARYVVHKDASSNLMLMASTETKIFNLKGIQGEGIYLVEEGKVSGTFHRVSFVEMKTNKSIDKLIQNKITNDLNNRQKLVSSIVDTKKFSAMLREGKDVKTALKEYKEVDTNKIMSTAKVIWESPIYLDPEVEKKTLVVGPLKAGSMEFIKYKGHNLFAKNGNTWSIPAEGNPGMENGEAARFELAKTGEDYYIMYSPKTQALNEEFARFMSVLTVGANSDGVRLPGYAKYGNDNEAIVLIDKNELKNFGIEALSDKSLVNKNTNQRAFLNTDESFTLIGNNVTHYPPDQLMVKLYGEKVFYNLNIIMELINDTTTVMESAGKDIYVSTEGEKFKLVDIQDVELGTTVDKTYMLTSTNSSDKYMNISALAGLTSNFIYFKSKVDNNIEALVVYKPKTTKENKAGQLDNTLKSYLKDTTVANSASSQKDQYGAKDLIISKLFKTNSKDAGDIFSQNYVYDIYIITSDSTLEPQKAANNMLSFLSDGKEDQLKLIKDNAYIDPAFNVPGAKSDTNLDIKFKSLSAGKSFGNDFLMHGASNNLYFRIKKGNQNQTAISKKYFYQNFMLHDASNTIKFRRYHYYTNTPEKYIPLEVYGRGVQYFAALDTGTALKNFGSQKYKLSAGSGDSSINIVQGEEVGMFTKVELPWVKLDKARLEGMSNEELDNYLYKLTLEEFKKVAPDYKLDEVLKNSKVGWKNTMKSEIKKLFFSGSWDGVVNNKSFYTINSIEGKKILPNTGNFNIITTGEASKDDGYGITKASSTRYNLVKVRDLKVKEIKKLELNDRTISIAANRSEIEGDIYYKPSIAIPWGSTLVATDGKIEAINNAKPRDEIHYIADMINAMLFRMQDQKITYLFEIPRNSIVHLAEGKTVVKTGPAQTRDSGKLLWVWAITQPSEALFNKGSLTDYTIMSNFLSDWGNVDINYNFGKIKLKQIIGKGMYSIPSMGNLNSNVNKYKDALKIYDERSPIWITGSSDNDYYTLTAAKVSSGKFVETNSSSARLAHTTLLPPSIEVEKISTSESEHIYRVKTYHDVSKFQVDQDSSYIKYLMTRDTPAEDALASLNKIRSQGLDATSFLKYAKGVRVVDVFNAMKEFFVVGVPVLMLLLTVLINCLWLLLYMPISRNFIDDLSQRFGVDIIAAVTRGMLTSQQTPPYSTVAVISLVLVCIGMLFSAATIPDISAKMFVFFRQMIS